MPIPFQLDRRCDHSDKVVVLPKPFHPKPPTTMKNHHHWLWKVCTFFYPTTEYTWMMDLCLSVYSAGSCHWSRRTGRQNACVLWCRLRSTSISLVKHMMYVKYTMAHILFGICISLFVVSIFFHPFEFNQINQINKFNRLWFLKGYQVLIRRYVVGCWSH